MDDNPDLSTGSADSTDSDDSYTTRDTALIRACKMQDLAQVSVILASPGININAKDDSGYTALDCAIIGNRSTFQQDIVQALLVTDIDVNSSDNNGNTALFWAVGRGRRETIQALLARPDTNVNSRDNTGDSIVMRAVRRGPAAPIDVLTDLLADARIDVNAPNVEGDTPLIWAVTLGRVDTVRALLTRQDINVNAANRDGKTPLFLAADKWHRDKSQNHLIIARLLLGKQGIEVDQSTAMLLRGGGINKKSKSKKSKSKKSNKNKSNKNKSRQNSRKK